ncbi:hypothetical protein KP509_11G054700 [Ceratopteris richardii]|uniref:DUF7866 domain-containing protein n=1 Tax=Ceratopteris richardii TaxID=49495 RepID=A0A8T2TUW9_CERRI|nr:hypothetical protein KP509_11G054700 [Ceratopteris richardii]
MASDSLLIITALIGSGLLVFMQVEYIAEGQSRESEVPSYKEKALVQEKQARNTESSILALEKVRDPTLYPAEPKEKRWVADIINVLGSPSSPRTNEEDSTQVFRRRLSPFGVCSACKCCDTTQTLCSLTACCYSIVCNAPNQPFGLCSLSPSECNCLSCPIS